MLQDIKSWCLECHLEMTSVPNSCPMCGSELIRYANGNNTNQRD